MRLGLGRTVIALAVVSFLTDVSSEMIYPLLPVFLAGTLGASAAMIGAIEGAAETTASLLKLWSGWWSDRVRRRKPLVVFGYTVSSLARPLVAVAQSASHVLAIRLVDRVGKGVRGAPRDALIADSVDPAARGRAFGFHRAADHAGAVLGPLLAFAMIQYAGADVRTVFWLAAIPAAIAVVAVIAFVREAPQPAERAVASPAPRIDGARLPARFWGYLGVLLVFTLGNSTDAFLLLRAQQLGVPVAALPILWAALHLVNSAASTAGGTLSDRVGRVPTLIGGWAVFALVYFGFAEASSAAQAWGLFLAYGLFFALTEGPERALVADMVPASARGTAFGWFNVTIGLGALPASLLFGWLWDRHGAEVAFRTGAALAVTAAAALLFVPRPAGQQQR